MLATIVILVMAAYSQDTPAQGRRATVVGENALSGSQLVFQLVDADVTIEALLLSKELTSREERRFKRMDRETHYVLDQALTIISNPDSFAGQRALRRAYEVRNELGEGWVTNLLVRVDIQPVWERVTAGPDDRPAP
jgi:hypothetical protein